MRTAFRILKTPRHPDADISADICFCVLDVWDPKDCGILFKVLLNEKEATLPIRTDCTPYYHWRDFRKHYLKKIDAYKK